MITQRWDCTNEKIKRKFSSHSPRSSQMYPRVINNHNYLEVYYLPGWFLQSQFVLKR